jgi:hypothetical protein
MVRYLDYNDTYLSKEPSHPSDNITAALAIAENQKAGGRELIAAIVLAYEVQCRFCDAATLRARGWDHVTYPRISVNPTVRGFSSRRLISRNAKARSSWRVPAGPFPVPRSGLRAAGGGEATRFFALRIIFEISSTCGVLSSPKTWTLRPVGQ